MASITNAVLLIFITTFAIVLAYNNPALSNTQIGQVAENKTNDITRLVNTTNDQISIATNNSFVGTIAFELPLTWTYNAFKTLVSLSTAPSDIISGLDLPQIAKTGLIFIYALILLFAIITFWRIGTS